MGQYSGLFGVALGALLVGGTLAVREAFADAEIGPALRKRLREECIEAESSVKKGGAAARDAAEKAGKAILSALSALPNSLKKQIRAVKETDGEEEESYPIAEDGELHEEKDDFAYEEGENHFHAT